MDLLTAMRSFLMVAEQQSFSAAARQLNLANSAVSRQISELEAHYGTQLIYRTTRAMHLTAEGHYYRTQFMDLLGRLEQLESAANERQQKVAGHLRITAPQNSRGLGIQQMVSRFLQRNPQVTLSWLLVNRFVDLVQEGVDLAIRVGELADSGLIARPLGDQQVVFVASPRYLARQGTPGHPSELNSHHCVVDSSNLQPGRWEYLEGKRLRHVKVDARVEVNQGEVAAEYAAAGHGVTCLPGFLVKPYLESGRLVALLERYQTPPIPVSLVYPANRRVSPALKALVDYLLECSRTPGC